MTIDWWTLGLQTVNALVLLWILAHFLFRPVSDIIAARKAAAMDELDAARGARAAAEEARASAEADSAATAGRRAQVLAEAAEAAERERKALLDKARGEVERLREQGRATLERERAADRAALREDAGHLAADIAERLMSRLPEEARVAGFVDGLADAVAELPETTRAELGLTPIPLRAPRPLTDAETGALRARLADVLDREVALAPQVDESLIAGLELDAPHAVVRNHFRADLDRIRQELTQDD